jgi:hypothetical protein
MLTRRAFVALAFAAVLSSCTHAPLGTSILDQLYFGRGIPGGGEVTPADWAAFLAEVVTPVFPQGFAVVRTEGQWRYQTGEIVREDGFALSVVHPPDPKADAAIRAIIDAYKRRFHQESVLHLRQHVEAHF